MFGATTRSTIGPGGSRWRGSSSGKTRCYDEYRPPFMHKIGIIYGMENTFPWALVDRINALKVAGLSAEHVRVGGVKMAEKSEYRVIVDRISHDIPFYRAYL